MCHANLSTYPCGHTVFTSYTPCSPGQNPRTCSPKDVTIDAAPWTERPAESPSQCPGEGCFRTPPSPYALANAAEDAPDGRVALWRVITRVPTWIYDLDGNVIGTRKRPVRAMDYFMAVLRRRYLGQRAPVEEKMIIPEIDPAKLAAGKAWAEEKLDGYKSKSQRPRYAGVQKAGRRESRSATPRRTKMEHSDMEIENPWDTESLEGDV